MENRVISVDGRAVDRKTAQVIRDNRHDWSTREWARRLGVSQATVHRISAGKTYIEPIGRHPLPHAKLTPDQVRIIRRNREGMTDATRARLLGVTPGSIYRARNYITYRGVE